MRIGILVYGLDRAITGIGRYTLELVRALAARADAPEIILLTAGNPGPLGQDGRYPCVPLPGCRLLPGLLTLGQVEIARAAQAYRLDLVHDPSGVMPLGLVGCPRVVTVHDVFPIVRPQTSTFLDRLIYRGWLPRALPQASAVITDSECSKTDILGCMPVKAERVSAIPLAANPGYRLLPAREIEPVLRRHGIESPYILYVGSIEPRKNLAGLLRAFAHLNTKLPGWKLVLVGARNLWLSNPLVKEMDRLKLKSLVKVCGYVPEADLAAFYNGAGLFAFPSLYEGFGLPVLEAMACGTPVITSNISSLPEVAGEAALLVDPLDVESIAEAMRLVLQGPSLAEALQARSLAQAARFSWRRTAEATLAVYQKALEGQ